MQTESATFVALISRQRQVHERESQVTKVLMVLRPTGIDLRVFFNTNKQCCCFQHIGRKIE
jgi:hypothetical protein